MEKSGKKRRVITNRSLITSCFSRRSYVLFLTTLITIWQVYPFVANIAIRFATPLKTLLISAIADIELYFI